MPAKKKPRTPKGGRKRKAEEENDEEQKQTPKRKRTTARKARSPAAAASSSPPVAAASPAVAAKRARTPRAKEVKKTTSSLAAAAKPNKAGGGVPYPRNDLKMPSQQTPGRPKRTAVRSKVVSSSRKRKDSASGTIAAPPQPRRRLNLQPDRPKPQQEEEASSTEEDNAASANKKYDDSAATKLVNVIKEEEEDDENSTSSADNSGKKPLWVRTLAWFCLLPLLPKFVPGVNPFWGAVFISNAATAGYFSVFPLEPVNIMDHDMATAQAAIVERELRAARAELQGLIETSVAAAQSLETEAARLGTQFVQPRQLELETTQQSLKDIFQTLSMAVGNNNGNNNATTIMNAASWKRWQTSIRKQWAKTGFPTALMDSYLLDLPGSVQLWKIPKACRDLGGSDLDRSEGSVTNSGTLVDMGTLKQSISALKIEASKDAEVIMSNDDPNISIRIMKWVRKICAARMKVPPSPNKKKTAHNNKANRGGSGSSSLQNIRAMIADRLELERADGTGRVDYAAGYSGGSVVRSGDRATTPGLVDQLPIVNRVMASLGLRFYGYGPEAAITPTQTSPFAGTGGSGLGQCWSFTESRNSKYSAYATLTVRLARPVYVESVVIEHPVPEVTDRMETAIRSFRVVGFEDAGATGRPWPLGSFEYDIGMAGKPPGRQEFELTTEDSNYGNVPKLAAVSLAIDSNWGDDYACLYRFRVHGKEV